MLFCFYIIDIEAHLKKIIIYQTVQIQKKIKIKKLMNVKVYIIVYSVSAECSFG